MRINNAMQKKHLLDRVQQKGWLQRLEVWAMQSVVVRFWKQGWQATVAAARLMELVRQECGQLLTAIIEWGENARFYVQLAYYFLYKLLRMHSL